MATKQMTNVERLKLAAATLRNRGLPGDEHTAKMLELCEPIAIYWAEPYAAPFVPLLEAALRLARAVDCPSLVGYKLAADCMGDYSADEEEARAWPTVKHTPCGEPVFGWDAIDPDDVDVAALLHIIAAHRCEWDIVEDEAASAAALAETRSEMDRDAGDHGDDT